MDYSPWWRGLSRYQWLVLLVAWLGWTFDVMDTALFNFAKTPMLTELFGGAAAYKVQGPYVEGKLLSLLLIGWSIGGLFFGLLADRWGRAKTLSVTVLIYCVFTALTAFCRSWEQVAVVRFITALGIGGEWAAGAALLAEAFPDKARAPGAALLQSAAAIGPALAALANFAIPAEHWRWLFFVGVVPAFITVIVRLGVKEPARWVEAEEGQKGSAWEPLREMFGNPIWRRHALVALFLGVVAIAAAGNITFWLPNLVKEASKGLSDAVIKDRNSVATWVMHIGTLLGVFAMPWFCEKVGRRPALLVFFIASPISIVLASFIGSTYTALLISAPLMSFFTIGASAGLVLYFPELFPTRLRATGAGFAYNTGRILAAGIPIATGWIITRASHSSSPDPTRQGVYITGFVVLLGILALAFAPETKGNPLPD